MSSEARTLEIAEISSIMRTESGRNTMFRILVHTGLDHSTFSPDTHEHARLAGRREIGIWLRDKLLDAAPGEYFQMMKENSYAARRK